MLMYICTSIKYEMLRLGIHIGRQCQNDVVSIRCIIASKSGRRIVPTEKEHGNVITLKCMDTPLCFSAIFAKVNNFRDCTARQCSPLRRKFMECYIISPALSLLMKHLVIGQRQKAPIFSAFHWSPHGSLVSIGQHFVTTRVVHLPKRTETSLITESNQKASNHQLCSYARPSQPGPIRTRLCGPCIAAIAGFLFDFLDSPFTEIGSSLLMR